MEYKDTKLIAFIETFSKDELVEFEKFIISPYFKKGRDLHSLYKVILQHHPDFSSDKFNEEIVFKELYPEIEFGDKKSKDILKTLSSSLLKMAEEFIVISKLQKDKLLKNRIMLDEILDRDLTKFYEQYSAKAEKELNAKGETSGQNTLEKYFFEGIKTRYYSHVLNYENYYSHAVKSGEYISSYFLSNLLRISKLKYLSEAGRNIKPDVDIIDHLLDRIDIEDVLKLFKGTSHYVFIGFHYYTYLCQINKFEFRFYKLAKDIFIENKSQLNRPEKFYFYADLLNILNMSYASSYSLGTRKEIFEVVNLCIKDKAYKFSNDDFMQPDFYRNAILNAIFFKEYKWADNFINNYSKELKPVFHENLKYYSRALIFFEKEDFDNALANIIKVRYDLLAFKIDVKILSLKIYYELQMLEPAISMVDSFKHYIRSNKNLPDDIRSAYTDFLKYYSKTLNIKEKGLKEEASFISKEVKENYLIAQKKWLLKKLEVL